MLRTYILKNPSLEGIPKKYCLGAGHMKFFKNKVRYLRDRHNKLVLEQARRGFKHNSVFSLEGFKSENLKDWIPTKEDINLNLERIFERINKKRKFYKYYSKCLDERYIKNVLSSSDYNLEGGNVLCDRYIKEQLNLNSMGE